VPNRAVQEQLEAIEAGWQELRAAIERLGPQGLQQRTPSGWSVREMIAHIAFWEETVEPVIDGMYRGREVVDWYGGDDLGLGPDDPWPVSAVHNAREAAWARAHTDDEVLARWERAHRRMVEVVATITDDEAEREEYLVKVGAATVLHYAEHASELDEPASAEQWAT